MKRIYGVQFHLPNLKFFIANYLKLKFIVIVGLLLNSKKSLIIFFKFYTHIYTNFSAYILTLVITIYINRENYTEKTDGKATPVIIQRVIKNDNIYCGSLSYMRAQHSSF